MMRTLEQALQKLSASANGHRPEILRELGDALAALDVAQWVDARAWLPERTGLRATDLDALRADALARVEELRRAQQALRQAGDEPPAPAENYVARRGIAGTPMLFWRKRTADGVTEVLLAHFVARAVAERVRHRANGEVVRVITVELDTVRGPRTLEVLPEDLADPRRFYAACVHAAGAEARLATTVAAKHLPLAALELADPKREYSEVYEFIGWHETDAGLVYLSAGGTIGAEGLTVDLSNLAAGAGVPALATFGPRDDGDGALATALDALAGPLRQCFPDLVTLPCLAAVFLAPLLRWTPVADKPGLHLVGTTGTRKTSWLSLLQAFYGPPEPTMSWRSTANSIEIALSALRDALVTVDDMKMSTSDRGVWVKILQSYADRRGRSRATRTGELARARFVGGLLVSAGEDVVAGEASVAARTLFVPIGTDDADLDALTNAQAAAAALPTLTARYIGWLIERHEDLAALMDDRFTEARDRYRYLLANQRGLNDAGRVAVNCALLETAADIGCDWLRSVGWSGDQGEEWVAATRDALERLARLQAEAISEQSAALAFLRALRALLDSRRVELAEPGGTGTLPALSACSPMAPGSILIGWRLEDEILLQPELALAEVRRWLASQGMRFDVSRQGLYAQLRDGGWLADMGQRTTVVRWIAGGAQRVLSLRVAALSDTGACGDESVSAVDEVPLF